MRLPARPGDMLLSVCLLAMFCGAPCRLLGSALAAAPTTSAVVINEFMASNENTIADADGDYSDWIELYNAGPSAIGLAGHTLTDDADEIGKWHLPALELDAGQFLLIWASGKDRITGELHTSFRLRQSGEFVGLFGPGGTVVDSLSYGAQITDVSSGRLPDGADELVMFGEPTPGGGNVESPFATLSCSADNGVHGAGLIVELWSDLPESVIRYTTDGGMPGTGSRRYTGALTIDETRVLRVRAFLDGQPVSAVMTRTFVVNEQPGLAVLSVMTDPGNLWDDEIGIMENFNQRGIEWEREGHVTLIEEESVTSFSVPTGIRIHGNYARRLAKKSFRLYFRRDYGASSLDHPLFEQKPLASFDSIVLHAGSRDQPTDSETPTWSLLRDTLGALRWPEWNGLVSGFKPVSLYLNGEYWGLYWIREHMNDKHLETYFGIEDADLLLAHVKVKLGDEVYWEETKQFFETHDLGNPGHYATAAERYVSIDDFIDYQIVEIFLANWDWPHFNTLRFRDRAAPDPWRWLFWDTDTGWASYHSIQVDHNTLAWASRDNLRHDLAKGDDAEWKLDGTLVLRSLLENGEFRRAFINRFADLLNTTLAPEVIVDEIDRFEVLLEDEIRRETARWGSSRQQWRENLDFLRDFGERRAGYVRGHIREQFDLDGTWRLTLRAGEGDGGVAVNWLAPLPQEAMPWTGRYFDEVPIVLTAVPAPGSAFAGWSDPSLPQEPVITIETAQSMEVRAHFVVVNEPPVAVDDQAQTAEDTAVSVAVLANDADPDGDPLALAELGAAGHGTVSEIEAGVVRYVPEDDHHGDDTFDYVVSDGRGGQATGTARVTIFAVNDAPLAVDDEAATDEDLAVSIDLLDNDSDPDGDLLTLVHVTQAGPGNVSVGSEGEAIYTPARDHHGEDGFTYTIRDAAGATATAAVVITIRSVNDAPLAVDDQATTPIETPITIPVLDNDLDPDGDPLELLETAQGTLGDVAIVGPQQTLAYTPHAGVEGVDRFSYRVGDDQGASAEGWVEVVIGSVNLPPVAIDDVAATDEDVAIVIDLLDNDSDPDGDSFMLVAFEQGGFASVTDLGGGAVRYLPDADAHGTDAFHYTIRDDGGREATARVDVSVQSINDPPVVDFGDPITFPEDGHITLPLDPKVSDPDDAATLMTWLIAIVDESPGWSGLLIDVDATDRAVTLRGAPDYHRDQPIRVECTAIDPAGGAGSDTLAVRISAVNDPPGPFRLIAPSPTGSVHPDSVRLVWSSATDVDGDVIVYAVSVTAARLDTVIAQSDTTAAFGLRPYAEPDEELMVTWSVEASDGELVTPSIDGTRSFLLLGAPPLPTSFSLLRSVPNPFRPTQDSPVATIAFDLPESSRLRLEIYNSLGRRVRILVEGEMPAGSHGVEWDGRDESGEPVPSGVYFYRLRAGGRAMTEKLLVVR